MAPETKAAMLTGEALRSHWQGHRDLTRRVIEAYPEEELFSHSLGGMRSFGEMVLELLAMAVPMAKGLATDDWEDRSREGPLPKAELLRLWDRDTEEIDEIWPAIEPDRFQARITAFGQWTARGIELLLYVIDNEIHHRGQGYVYLRSLGVDPPPFYQRGPWA